MSGPVPPVPHMPTWRAQADFAFTDISFYYCIRSNIFIRKSTLFWQILGSNPWPENEFSGSGLMCSQDRGTGPYPKPTASNLNLPTHFLKTNVYVTFSSTQISSKKKSSIFLKKYITRIDNVHACCLLAHIPDSSLKTEYMIHLMLCFHLHLEKDFQAMDPFGETISAKEFSKIVMAVCHIYDHQLHRLITFKTPNDVNIFFVYNLIKEQKEIL